MKQISILTALAVLVAFTACTKEDVLVDDINTQDEVQEGFVRMRFSAQMESDITKAYLSGTSVLWAGDESIAVFDHDAGGAAIKFDAESSGATTSFVGDVPVGTVRFTAVYPYKSTIAYEGGASSPITTEIPSIQEATLNSFDPSAAIFVATATNTTAAFSFTPAFALFKVNVDVDNVVQVNVSTTSNSLAGSVKVSRGGGLGNGDGTLSKTIVLKKSDNSVLEKGDYYIVTRFLKEGQSFANFTIKYFTSEAKMKSRVSASGIPDDKLVRKAILNLGSLSSIPGDYSTNRYEYYQAGFDVKVGDKTFNKTKDGDATLITSASGVKNISSTIKDQDAVFFLDAAGGTFNLNGQITVSAGELVLINNSDNVATVTTADKRFDMIAGSLYLKGLSLDISGRNGNGYFGNTTAASNSKDLVVDGCVFYGMNSYELCRFAVKDKVVKNIEFVNCVFKVSKEGNYIVFNLSDNEATLEMERFVFKNNLVYHTTGSSYRVSVLTMPAYSSGSYALAADFSNNLFINVPSQSAYTAVLTDVSSFTFDNNIFFEGNGYGSNCYLFDIKNTSSTVSSVYVSGNVVIGLSSSKKWFYSSDGVVEEISSVKTAIGGTNEIAKSEASSVFSSTPTVEGGEVSYTLLPAYSSVGPQAL